MATILIVHDDATLLNMLAEQIQAGGYSVVRATDAQSAHAALETAKLDVALVDPSIAGIFDWQLVGDLAQHVSVIIVSDHGLEEDVVRGLDAGAVDYLARPYRAGELLARLRAQLRAGVNRWEPEPIAATEAAAPVTIPLHSQPLPPAETAQAPASVRQGERNLRRRNQEEEPVFMSIGDEQKILNDQDRASFDASAEELAALPLGQRLRTARQRRRITLVQAELESKLRMHYIQAIEEEKFSLLPRGPFAEDMLKRYAAYVGVEPGTALGEYRRLHYSSPIDPPRALGGLPTPRQMPRWLIWLAAVVLALAIGGGMIGAINAYNPQLGPTLANGALLLFQTATPTPTSTPLPSATPTNPPVPTDTPTPLPTEAPTITPLPTELPPLTPTP